MNQTFDLTPDPRVLLALTHTPLAPLDALCELIDNSIDAFTEAERSNARVEHPLIVVEIPGVSELNRRAGILRLRDNGGRPSFVHAVRSLPFPSAFCDRPATRTVSRLCRRYRQRNRRRSAAS